MKHFLALIVPVVVLFAVSLGGGTAAAQAPTRSQLVGFACQRALDPPDRSISVKAVMRPVTGTRKLSLKFELLEKSGSAPAHSVTGAGDLGVWLSPTNPTLGQRPGDVWELNKAVYDLDAPARYSFRVTFRWLGAHNAVLATAVRESGVCVQKELRPDLLVKGVTVNPIPRHPHKERYTAVIANHGATGAGPFQVLFTPGDGSTPQTQTVQHIGAYSAVRESFIGPVCNASTPPTVVADSTSRVDDDNRDNNALTVTCPATAPSRIAIAHR
jgi:hypothetical protein